MDFVEDIIKIEIIAVADRKTQKFFQDFKGRLKLLLQQVDVLITAQDIHRIRSESPLGERLERPRVSQSTVSNGSPMNLPL